MEPGLSKLEGAAGALVDRIITARSLGVLSEEDRVVLAIFVAVQMLRGPNQRETMLAMNQDLRRVLGGRFGVEDGDFPELTSEGQGDHDEVADGAAQVRRAHHE